MIHSFTEVIIEIILTGFQIEESTSICVCVPTIYSFNFEPTGLGEVPKEWKSSSAPTQCGLEIWIRLIQVIIDKNDPKKEAISG